MRGDDTVPDEAGIRAPGRPTAPDLQKDLTKLVQDKYQVSLSPKVNLRIALVNMTEAKHHTPIFAGFWAFNASNPGGEATMEGGSLVKIR